jgi:ribose transport system substrate-binding protein
VKRKISILAGVVALLLPLGSNFASGANKQLVIGYISGGEASPFVNQVTKTLQVAAKKAKVKLVVCDTNFLSDKALECAKTIKAAKPKIVINWQFDPTVSKKVCAAYGNLPTIALDSDQAPCQKVIIGADNYQAGLVAGDALSQYATKNSCNYDLFIQVEVPTLPDLNKKRAGGTREGFEKICGAIPDSKYKMIDKTQGGSDALENIRRQATDLLTANPNATSILVSSPYSDADAISLTKAFDTAGRGTNLKALVAHGAENVGHDYIRNDARWVGSVGYFPETYGARAIDAAVKMASGKKVAAELLTKHKMVTKANINSLYPAS